MGRYISVFWNEMPLLVEIPDRHGNGTKKDFITSYITEAIELKL